MINVYQTESIRLAGTDYREVSRKARAIYNTIASKSKRKPYVRSAYFNKEKVFLDYFWQHLFVKNNSDRLRRLKYYGCALELIQKSKIDPVSKENVDNVREILHRFAGKTRTGELFFVQIKEDKRNRQKHFISLFPYP